MNNRPQDFATAITQRWIWLLDVVFGATAAFGFENLQQSIRSATSTDDLVKQIFSALALYIFFLYDVSVLHILIQRYPYKVNIISVCRYFLDVCMAFLLMLILIPGLQEKPEDSTVVILFAITTWHISAFVWHLLAHIDQKDQANPPDLQQVIQPREIKIQWKTFISHFTFAGIYWLVFGFSCGIQCWHKHSVDVKSVQHLYFLCITIITVSLWRTWHVFQLFDREINDIAILNDL